MAQSPQGRLSPVAASSPPAAPTRLGAALAALPALRQADVAEAHARATRHSDIRTVTCLIGGLQACFAYADRAVESCIRPAFRHLESPPSGAPDFTLHLWQDTPEHPFPRLPAHARWMEHRHVVHACTDARHCSIREDWLGTHSQADLEARVGYYCVKNAAALPYYETAAPLRALLQAWLNTRGRLLVHGAAVGTESGGLLLAGDAGAGKSSTALSCLGSGLRYLADDWTVLSCEGPPTLHSLYNTAKLRPENLARFPDMRRHIHNHDKLDEEKATLFLAEHFPRLLLRTCPARAIVLPRVAGAAETTWTRAPGLEGWKALAECTLRQIPGAGEATLRLIGKFCARLPAYRLHLADDRPGIPAALERLLAGLPA